VINRSRNFKIESCIWNLELRGKMSKYWSKKRIRSKWWKSKERFPWISIVGCRMREGPKMRLYITIRWKSIIIDPNHIRGKVIIKWNKSKICQKREYIIKCQKRSPEWSTKQKFKIFKTIRSIWLILSNLRKIARNWRDKFNNMSRMRRLKMFTTSRKWSRQPKES
jgi:hypothetical protein